MQRIRKGIYSSLVESDPSAFARHEIDELELLINRRDDHLRLSINHIQKARRKQVVIILDNADQRYYETQHKVFLIAQELAQGWPVTVFVALRPETYYRSARSGALSAYHPKAFTISPPRSDIVIEKRLRFAMRVTSGDFPILERFDHTALIYTSLHALMEIFLQSISASNKIVECIDNTSGGNMRVALDMVKNFFGSSHVDTQKMITLFQDTGS